ncbi:MAG: hypothetical protein Q9Q40_14515 [Acidobacteriota bacterium]|nr:hypothetical protein [Acidobacteriota bacterium]
MDDLLLPDTRTYVGKRNTTPWKAPENKDAPVYAPKVLPLDVEAIITVAVNRMGEADTTVTQLRAVRQWLNDPTLHKVASVHVGESEVKDEQLSVIREAGLLREVAPRAATTKLRFTCEVKKGAPRNRTLMHTHAGNDAAHVFHPSMMRVNSMNTLKRMARRNKVGATRDFKSFYHQLRMSEAVGEKYVVKVGDKYYALTRAAMGHKSSAPAAHSITRALAIMAARGEAEWDVIIDDVAFFAKDEPTLQRVLARFDELCATASVTVGTATPPSTQVEHRGIVMDMVAHTVRIRESTVTRIKSRVEWYKAAPTIARAKSLAGAAIAAGQVVQIPVRAIMRSVAQYVNTGVPADFSALHQLADQTVPNAPDKHDPVPFVGTIVADATLTSYGGVYVDPYGQVWTASGTFAPGQFTSVAEAEAAATIYTARLLPQRRMWSKVDIFTDNMVWYATQQRRWAKSDTMEPYRVAMAELLASKRITADCFWVASADNPTDGISRQRTWLEDDTTKLKELLLAQRASNACAG